VATNLGLAVGTGGVFAGHDVVDARGVIYIASERAHTIPRRLAVARQGLEPAPFYIAQSCPRLTDPDAADRLVSGALRIDLEMNRRHSVHVGLIIIDTLVTAAGWESENNNAEVQQVMHVLRTLSDELETFVLAIDHHGKDSSRGTRGASDKEASADLVLHLTDSNSMRVVKCSEGRQGKETSFQLREHEIGKDDWGAVVTECSVEWGDEGQPSGRLRAALQEAGETQLNGQSAWMENAARQAFYTAIKDATPDARRQAWSRAVRKAGLVKFTHGGKTYLMFR
jgi:hypothetical protein